MKRNSDHRDGIDRMTVLLGGTKPDPSGGIDRILFQAVAEAPYDPQDAEISGGGEKGLEHDVAFDACPARFLRVAGTGLK
ncbi:MAG TPA: hypothetical protein VKJ01_22180 [Candidatus Solibacter sp.]|nr:hypothetical protein [Candidatus Solibacter sp.]